MKRTLLLPAAALAVGVLAGCGTSATTSATTPAGTPTPGATTAPVSSAATAAAVITIKNYGFMVPGGVSPGERITVHNDDTVTHTVTADTGGTFDVTVPASGTATLTAPGKAGSYAFHCTYHAEMHGTLVVR
jgi:plastocyanin